MPLVDPVTMSATSPKSSSSAQSTSKLKDGKDGTAVALQPVQINASPLAQTARHVLPAAQTALFVFRFNDLVASPVSTMAGTLPLAALLQVAYALICLPPAGSQSVRTSKKPRPGEKKKATDASGPNVLVAALLSLLLTTFATPLFHVAMVLFGAPLLTDVWQTLLCAAHLSVLSLFPLFYARGVDGPAWLAIGGFRAPFDEAFGALVGGVAGAWLGAVPIPLDWDREWQKWPVTILCGVYAGYLLGKTVGGTVAFGARF